MIIFVEHRDGHRCHQSIPSEFVMSGCSILKEIQMVMIFVLDSSQWATTKIAVVYQIFQIHLAITSSWVTTFSKTIMFQIVVWSCIANHSWWLFGWPFFIMNYNLVMLLFTSNCFLRSYNLISETVEILVAIAMGSGLKVKLLIKWTAAAFVSGSGSVVVLLWRFEAI